jgi:hypothetical protein
MSRLAFGDEKDWFHHQFSNTSLLTTVSILVRRFITIQH